MTLLSANESDAAAIIQAHVRGRACASRYRKCQKSAMYVQACFRGHFCRLHHKIGSIQRETDEEAALRIVHELLQTKEDPSTSSHVAAMFFTPDFLDERNMTGTKTLTRGIRQYIALKQTRSAVSQCYTRPKIAQTRQTKTGSLIVVEQEVCLGGLTDVKITFDVVLRGSRNTSFGFVAPRIARRCIEPLQFPRQSSDKTNGWGAGKNSLKDSFAALDVDASGHLSIDEIVSASALVGLRFCKRQLAKELLLGDADGDNRFELHEMDAIGIATYICAFCAPMVPIPTSQASLGIMQVTLLPVQLSMCTVRQQRALNAAGIEDFHKPLVFDVLPLVARTFDAHLTVNKCLALGGKMQREEQNSSGKVQGRAFRSTGAAIHSQTPSALLIDRPAARTAERSPASEDNLQKRAHRADNYEPSIYPIPRPAISQESSKSKSTSRLPPLIDRSIMDDKTTNGPGEKTRKVVHADKNKSRYQCPVDSSQLQASSLCIGDHCKQTHRRIPTSNSAPNIVCRKSPTLTLSATTSGLPPLRSSTGLIAALPLQTLSERQSAVRAAKCSHDRVSVRLAASSCRVPPWH